MIGGYAIESAGDWFPILGITIISAIVIGGAACFSVKPQDNKEEEPEPIKKDNKPNIWGLVISAFVVILIIAIGARIMQNLNEQIEYESTYDCCCNGNPCSDTYYNIKDNTCHLTMCENIPYIINRSQCTYLGDCSRDWNISALASKYEGI